MKAVIFDMDGVLFDTEQLCMESWVAAAKARGISDMEKVFPLCIGRNAEGSKQVVLGHYGEAFPYQDFRKEASKLFWEKIEKDGQSVKPGAREILKYLKYAGWKVGLASSTRREDILRHLEKAEMLQYFSEILGGDQIVYSKPAPDIYLLACEKLGTKPEETYAVEDSYNGIRSAHSAGMMPVMVPDMLQPTQEMEELCVGIFQDLFQVREFFGRED